MKATALQKHRGYVMESARTTQHVAGQREELAHSQVITPPKGDGDDMNTRVGKLINLRKEYKVPQLEAGVNLVQTALMGMIKDPSIRDEYAVVFQSGRYGDLARMLATNVASNEISLAQLSAAMTKYAHAYTGASETKNEIQKMASLVANGDETGVVGFLEILDNDRRQYQKEAYKMDPEAYAVMQQRGAEAEKPTNYAPRTLPAGSKAKE
jgi:hypothetical protein